MIIFSTALLPKQALGDGAGGTSSEKIQTSDETSFAAADHHSTLLVEEFTAYTLGKRHWKIGTELESGATDSMDIGFDLVAAGFGVPTLQLKGTVWTKKNHTVSLAIKGAYFNRASLLWGNAKKDFDVLEAQILRPAIVWSRRVSPRLFLHTFWAKGLGSLKAELSSSGLEKYRNAKTIDADELPKGEVIASDEDDEIDDVDSSDNQEKTTPKRAELTTQTLQLQSITGLVQNRFQLTGEYIRTNGNKILVTTRIEQSKIEDLKSQFFRQTVSHQWIWSNFQMRLGFGAQYFALSGEDLDGEDIDETGTQPTSDVSFYFRF